MLVNLTSVRRFKSQTHYKLIVFIENRKLFHRFCDSANTQKTKMMITNPISKLQVFIIITSLFIYTYLYDIPLNFKNSRFV